MQLVTLGKTRAESLQTDVGVAVEQMGGTIRVESSHHQTCFIVCIGLAKPGNVTSGG